jgi:dienelactone hydrolase
MEGQELPKPTGRFAAGRARFDLKDESREETLGPSGIAAKRELVVWVWYPAMASDESTVAPYLPQGWEASDTVMGSKLGTAALQSHSLDGVGPAAEGPFPVLLFSPAGFSPLSYAAIVEELASHGFVVAGICHTYEAPVTVLADGRSIPARPDYMMKINAPAGEMQEVFDFRAGVALLKRDDMAFVATSLMTLDSPVRQLMAPGRIAAFGHSLGGNAALELARADQRCLAAVNLDGANWSDVGRAGLYKPAMILACEHPEMLAPPESMVEAGAYPTVEWCLAEREILFGGWQKVVDTGRPGSMHTIAGARHANVADVQFVTLPDDSPMRAVLGPGDPEAIWRETCDRLLEFFAEHVP